MSISLRKRGDFWYARGTVRVGTARIKLAEFSTGCHLKSDADAVAAETEARIRREHIDGPSVGRQRTLTLDDAFAAYLTRPGGVPAYDAQRIREFSDKFGSRPMVEAVNAWNEWLTIRGRSLAPATVNRWRAIYRAALAAGCAALNAGTAPDIPSAGEPTNERLVYLSDAERVRLLGAYTVNAADVMVALAYQGFRTQEALRLDWRYVNLERGSIHIVHSGVAGGKKRTKSGRGRTVPMHARTREMLIAMLRRRNVVDFEGNVKKPDVGAVFLSNRKKPYGDTRGKGGNPLRRAHETACKAAGIVDFRVHDWRHDWAAANVMAGLDLFTLMKLGGWSSLRMVEKYASVSADHMRDAAARRA